MLPEAGRRKGELESIQQRVVSLLFVLRTNATGYLLLAFLEKDVIFMCMIFKRKVSREILEKKVAKWLSSDEKIEASVYEELKPYRYQFLVVTKHRAILFESDMYGRLQDKSDKLWRQLISVHLKQGHHDTSQFHNPYQVQEPFEQICWHLTGLNQEQAGKVYANLKEKEREWKETRFNDYKDLLKMPGRPGGMGGGSPPPRG